MSFMEEKIHEIEIKDIHVTAGLYRVTEFLSDDEPLKWILRKDSLLLLDYIAKTNKEDLNEASHLFEKALSTVTGITKKLTIFQVGGVITRTNFQVLEEQYAWIKKSLEFLLSMMYKEDACISKQNVVGDLRPESSRGSAKSSRYMDFTFDHTKENSDGEPGSADIRKRETEHSSSINERQENLLSFLGGRGFLSLREIAAFYERSVSNKTIQRDLTELLSRGLIKSVGEKRWKKYAFKNEVVSSQPINP